MIGYTRGENMTPFPTLSEWIEMFIDELKKELETSYVVRHRVQIMIEEDKLKKESKKKGEGSK